MRKRAAVASVLSSAAVLVFGWQLGTQVAGVSAPLAVAPSTSSTTTTGPASTAPSGTGSASTGSTSTGSTSTGSASTPSAAPAAGVTGTYTGALVSTRFGTVQVAITVAQNQITDVTALKLTDDGRKSVSISNRAAPVLRTAVLAAQSARVSVVSGATYTSDAYLQSLQSALDQAGL